jgi:hypothetical protein
MAGNRANRQRWLGILCSDAILPMSLFNTCMHDDDHHIRYIQSRQQQYVHDMISAYIILMKMKLAAICH